MAWDISKAVYSKSFSVGAQTLNPANGVWSPDGTKFFLIEYDNDNIYQYTASTPGEVDSLTLAKTFDVSSQDSAPHGLFIKPDGLKLYLLGASTDKIHQYTFSAAWDINTLVYDNKFLDISGEDTTPRSLFIRADGIKLYFCGEQNDKVYQYTFGTAWDIDTLTYDSKSFYVGGYLTSPRGLFIKPDGLKFYVTGATNDKVYQYTFSSAWDISTLVYDSKFLDVGIEDTEPRGIFIKDDGSILYYSGGSANTIYQYTIPDTTIVYLDITASAKSTAAIDRIAEKNLNITSSSKSSVSLNTPDFLYAAITANAENTNFVNFYSPFTYGFTENITCTDVFYASNLTSGLTFTTIPTSVFDCVNLSLNITNTAKARTDVDMDIVSPIFVVDSMFTVSDTTVLLEASSLAVSGTVDVTCPDITLESYGGGVASLNCPDVTLTASGFVGVFGTLDVVNPSCTLEATGIPTVGGTFDETISDIFLDSIGLAGCIGTVDVILPDVTLNAEGGFTVTGTAEVTIPDVVLYAAGRLESRFSSEILRHSRY